VYKAPLIEYGHGAARKLKDVKGTVQIVTMEIPWRLFRAQVDWRPERVHEVADMDLKTLEALDAGLPPFDVVVGIGGGSCCDTAKYLAWKRGVRMILVPTIVSVDAPLTNAVGVRVDKVVTYVGDIWPEEILVDYDIIRKAPPELNRAGACDIASIHTGLFDWRIAHEDTGEKYDEYIAAEASDCLHELDRMASDVHDVTPEGIRTLVDLYRREVEFCARLGSSRPEEGSEHIVAYAMEHLTRRHFLHGDLVGLGLFVATRLQDNDHAWTVNLLKRTGLRYTVPDASREEIRECIATLKPFKDKAGLFYSILDREAITPEFVDDTLAALGR